MILKRPEFSTYHETEFYLCSDVNKWLDQAYAILDKARVVYGDDLVGGLGWFEQPGKTDMHKALLINVEPIEEKECRHELANVVWINDGFKCRHCGKKLKPTWEVIE